MNDTKPEQAQVKDNEVDDKGVPLINRFKELERKIEEKWAKELEQTRLELAELKAQSQAQKQSQIQYQDGQETAPDAAKKELMDFVKDPNGYTKAAWQKFEFERQLPEAEAWLREQDGYSSEARSRVDRIIYENKLNTPFHGPMERARTAWKILQAEMHEKNDSSKEDDSKREKSAANSGEGVGKSIQKQNAPTRQDLIRKLAKAEAEGDIDSAIKYTSLLEDVR